MENAKYHQPELPDKLYFKVGEVSDLTGIPAYVLRFWETEFAKINPKRTPSGQRLYRKTDVQLIFKIKYLLYEKRFTIKGAKQHLKSTATPQKTTRKKKDKDGFLKEIREELESIRKIVG